MNSSRPVPERIHHLLNELFDTPTRFCFERARLVTQSYKETQGLHPALRRARALSEVFEQMPIFIRPGELLVGQRASILAGRAVYPEYHLNGLKREITPAEIWDYWHGRTLGDITRRSHPERLRLAEQELATGYVTGTGSGFGHVIVDYEKAIKVGFRAIIREARARLDEAPADDLEGRSFLEGVIVAAQGLIRWAERYAELAEAQAGEEEDPARRSELLRIARVCRHVPGEPARDFWEALQAFCFVHLAMHIEQFGWSISAGRFDQYLYPYFKPVVDRLNHTPAPGERYSRPTLGDRVNGGPPASTPAWEQEEPGIPPDLAWELLLNCWVKFMENVDLRVGDTLFQNLTLGGQDQNGRDATNELSFWCLDATLALKVNQPALSVRWHPRIDPVFWNAVHQALVEGLGMPALFNDTVIIPALVSHGVSPEDAVGYGIVGCVEASVPGKEQGMTAGGHINLAKALELALNEGRSMITGRQIGLPTAAPESFSTFDDLWQAYKDQVEYLCGLDILATHIAGEMQKLHGHCPLMSSLLDDCLAQRRDLVFGGTRYNLPGIAIFGPSNVADSLMAVRRWVCEERRVTFSELRQALLDDFQGCEGLRQMLSSRTPRFGNDQGEVDELANQVNAIHAEYCWKQVDSRNGRYTSGVWPVNCHVQSGQWTAATPDGRHKGDPLVDGVGACQGADRNGPTALLKSVARLDNIQHWPAGNVCNIKFPPSCLRDAEGPARLRDLVTTFMQLGGQQLQVNVVDAATLRSAQADPGSYRHLIVRVAGYSAYFTQLPVDVQEEIISRTEQRI